MSADNLDKEIAEGLARAERMIQRRKRMYIVAGIVTLVVIGLTLGGLLWNNQPVAQGLSTLTALTIMTATQTVEPTQSATATITPTIEPTATSSPTPTQTAIPAQHLLFLAENKSGQYSIYSMNMSSGKLATEGALPSIGDFYARWTNAGDKLALISRNNKVYIWHTEKNAIDSLSLALPAIRTRTSLVWSWDGGNLAIKIDEKSMSVIDLETSSSILYRSEKNLGWANIDWLPISDSVIYHELGKGLMRVDVDNLYNPEIIMLYTSHIERFVVSPDGSFVAILNDGRVLIYPVRTQGSEPVVARRLPAIYKPLAYVSDMRWSPDGQKISIWVETYDGSTVTNTIIVLDTSGSILAEKKLSSYKPRGSSLGKPGEISWSLDSQFLAYSMPTEDGLGSKIYVSNIDGSDIMIVSAGDDFEINIFPGWVWK